MKSKPETVIKQIEELPEFHSKPLLQFKDWLIDEYLSRSQIEDAQISISKFEPSISFNKNLRVKKSKKLQKIS